MIEIIPAIDLIGGACVRLSQGDYNRQRIYDRDPLDVALQFEQIGIRRLHIVDLEGAKAAAPCNLKTLERIASRTALEIEYGGGIKNRQALTEVFAAGAARAICGSIAVREPALFAEWIAEFGGDRLLLGADVRNGVVAIQGWLEQAQQSAAELIERFRTNGLRQVICTDIARDGMLCRPDIGWYQALQAQFPTIEICVSGGIADLEDLEALNAAQLRSAIVGKAIYEGRIHLKTLEQWLQNA